LTTVTEDEGTAERLANGDTAGRVVRRTRGLALVTAELNQDGICW
jgi:hypothetical protein